MFKRLWAALAVIAVGVALVSQATADAKRSEWYGWDFLGTRCHVKSTNYGDFVFPTFGVRMFVHNGGPGGHWATNMRVELRLESPNSGHGGGAHWRKARYPAQGELLQEHNYNYAFRNLRSDPQPAESEWDVAVKLIWDRKAPFHDIVKKFKFPLKGCEGDPNCPLCPVGPVTRGSAPPTPARVSLR